MQRYVVYKRVSTRKQGDSGLGLEAQERDIRLFLENYSEEPWEVIAEYMDILSGSNGNRPELRKAMDLARREGATLLVAKLDRLSRKVSFIATLMDDRRLNFRVAQMPHADKAQLHLYALISEMERDFISTRTKAALAEAKRRGVKLGGQRPEADRRHKAVKEQADRQAARVSGIVLPMREAGRSLQEIADELNRSGVDTPRGKQWYPASVHRVLSRIAQ